MAKEVSTGIRAFVKDSLNQYYKRFLVKLDDNPSKNSNKSAIKIHNDGSIYVYDIGNYTGSVFDDASTLLEVIKAIGQGHGTRVEAGDNIQVDSTETISTISALGYTYNLEKNSFAELNSNIATGLYSHAEGKDTSALGDYSHAEGYQTETSGIYDNEAAYNLHVEGYYTKASGNNSHAEGHYTEANGNKSHAEGYETKANGDDSHAEGCYTDASGNHSHAEGYRTKAYGHHSHAEGYRTITRNEDEHAEGKYNQSHAEKTIHSIGIGTYSNGNSYRRNAFEVLNDGSIFITGLATANSYDGTSIINVSTLQEVINEKLDKSSAVAGLKYEVVLQLPTNPELNVIYLVPSATSIVENVYDEKMYINNKWETIGSTATDLSNYYTKDYIDGNYYTNSEVNVLIEGISLKAGDNIEITQDNSINALGYTYNSTTSTILVGNTYIDPVSYDKFVVGSGYGNLKMNSFRVHASGGSSLIYINESYDLPTNKTYIYGDVQVSQNITITKNATAAAFYQSSDERLKNIKSKLSIEDCYKLINDCSTIIYSLKTDEKDQNQIGMVAQQVKEIMPEVVQESNGYYSINYSRLSVVALNLVKDLSERIIELEKDHNKLEELIKRVEKLEK